VVQLLEEATELVRTRAFDVAREKLETARVFADADSAREEVDRRLAELVEVEAIEREAEEHAEVLAEGDDLYAMVLEGMPEEDRRLAEALGAPFRAAYEAYQREAWEEARRGLEALVADRPEAPLVLELLAGAAEHAGDDAAARDLYERCRRVDPHRAACALGLAALYRKEERREEAGKILADAAAARPVAADLPDAWVELHQDHALALAEAGRHDEAAGVIGALLDAKVGDPGTHYYNLAGMLEAQGRLGESRRALERAIQAAPRRAMYLERMADFLVKEGKHLDQALDCLVTANDVDTNAPSGAMADTARGTRISPHRARYLYKMARIYFLKGEDREAERLITTALALSRDESVTKALEGLRRELREASEAGPSE
jgi:tetratricopeptide (TPR) repeat protein